MSVIMNKNDKINQLINQTENKNNKNENEELIISEILEIKDKFEQLSNYCYIEKKKIKIGRNIRYYDKRNNKLSIQSTVMNIDYYDINKKKPKTVLLYSKYTNLQWNINCNKYIFFEQIMKSNSGLDKYMKNICNIMMKDEIEKYKKSL